MNIRLPQPQDFAAHTAVRDILKINADQARLGNALLLQIEALGSRGVSDAFLERIQALHDDIRATQRRLKATAVQISESVATGGHIRR